MAEDYHIPVLLNESIGGLQINPNGVYVDVTFGGGGHSRAILEKLSPKGRLIAFDQDADAEANLLEDERFIFVRHNFKYIRNFLRYHGYEQVDGILADLGVSSHHFDDAERGFSFRFDEALDMRMDRDQKFSAYELINEYPEEKLATIFWVFGELKNSRKIAFAIIKERALAPIQTIGQLKDIAMSCFSYKQGVKENRYLAQVFQSIRLEVNSELKVLEDLLKASMHVLAPGGRFSIITYHSLEDRMVKNFFRSGNIEGDVDKDFYGNENSPFDLVNRKVIVPSDEELERNPRARSAKLRIAERLEE